MMNQRSQKERIILSTELLGMRTWEVTLLVATSIIIGALTLQGFLKRAVEDEECVGGEAANFSEFGTVEGGN